MKKAGKSKFDLAIISLVREMREKKGLSQEDLASFLDVARSYIGHVESPHARAKYNINQLNRLAYSMGCTLHDLIPAKPTDEKVVSGRKKQKKKK